MGPRGVMTDLWVRITDIVRDSTGGFKGYAGSLVERSERFPTLHVGETIKFGPDNVANDIDIKP